MRFHADLHIHSKYSLATSRDLDLEHLAAWAGRKGIAVVGTGDFTHPVWRAELKEKLVPAEPGLFRLRDAIEHDVRQTLPSACQALPRFMLSVEISTIYKKHDRTRKVHHLIYAPDFETADRVSASLARIGNIASDGRPILGLDSRHLLEIALESGPGAYLVPAHIWTPWFAALGSQSGFDSIAECYGDLTDHIFAVETGLSSDPSMNWRLSQLDRYRLVSNSDAHSPGKLGREATTFDCAIDYYAIRGALETGEGYVGTVEFFPEEGKYHLDGHRKCGVRQTPTETLAHGGRCPVCGQQTTVGVLHRVEVLADRQESETPPPETAGEVASFVALPEIISELSGTGVGSRAVGRSYDRLVSSLGAELSILGTVPIEDIARSTSSLLAEAIARLRAGAVIRESGYDGEYGVIKLFEPEELRRLTSGDTLFDARARPKAATAKVAAASAAGGGASGSGRASAGQTPTPPGPLAPWHFRGQGGGLPLDPAPAEDPASATGDLLAGLDADQRAAASSVDGPLLIIAGPGSGKTRTLTHRIAYLVAERGVPASACLAITFTRRAAADMRERLAALLPGVSGELPIHTFHSLGLTILRAHAGAAGLPADFRIAGESERIALVARASGLAEPRAAAMLRAISKAKRRSGGAGAETAARADPTGAVPASGTDPAADAAATVAADIPADVSTAMAAYQQALRLRGWIDFDDLVGLALHVVSTNADVAAACRDRFRWISVDEFQDVDDQQYRLLTTLVPPDGQLCAIGDPNQAIYGFRGADASCFDRFARDYPRATRVELTRNYRSTGTIVAASSQVITSTGAARALDEIVREMHERITIQVAPSDRAEAELVVRTIDALMGGHSLHSIDRGRATPAACPQALGFSDFAVLYRTAAQAAAVRDALSRAGLPFAAHAHALLTEQPAVRVLLDARDPNSDGTTTLSDRLRAAHGRLVERADRAEHNDTSDNSVDGDDEAGDDGRVDLAARELALQRLLRLAASCADDESRFADALALSTEADFWDPRADRISLLTLHAAKGLEFPVVFIVGLEDGVLPLYWNELDAAAEAEERRLFYVGMTRARDRLFLTRAVQRPWRGKLRTLPASPFLDDIEAALVKHQQVQPPRERPGERQLRLL